MNRTILLGAALAALCAPPAMASTPPNISQTVGVCDPNFPQRCIKPDSSGAVPVTGAVTVPASAPYIFTSTGFQLVASFSTSTGFTPPATSTVCFIQAEGNSVRYRTDGVAPTSSTGALLSTGVQLQLTASLTTVKFIPTTGSSTLDVDCYK